MTSRPKLDVRRGQSEAADPIVAVRELHDAIGGVGRELVFFFCSPSYDAEVVGREIRRAFAEGAVVGCTTAGEIGRSGYQRGSICGVSFGREGLRASVARIDALSNLELGRGRAAVVAAKQGLAAKTGNDGAAKRFGLLVADGLSMAEDVLVTSLSTALGAIPLLGGSAADGWRFQRALVYVDGAFRADCAALTLVECEHPFEIVSTSHCVVTAEKLVVTRADPVTRRVFELNGEPACRELARALGVERDELGVGLFARHPLVVRIGGTTCPRAIQRANADGSLTFYCAIDEGIVLTLAAAGDLLGDLRGAFARVRDRVGPPLVTIGFDCALRAVEAAEVREGLGAVLAANNVVGFSTYGEQHSCMHVNQTFTGVAIGSAGAHD